MTIVRNLRLFPGSMRRALVALVAAVFVPVFALQIYSYIQRYEEAVDDEVQNDLEMARAIGAGLQADFLDVGRQELTLGQTIVSLRPFQVGQANALLRASVAEYASVRFFHWATPDGRIAASTNPDSIGVNVGDRTYFKEALARQRPVVSNLLMDRVSGLPAVIIARRISGDGGEVEGVVMASVNPANFGGTALSMERPEAGRFAVFDPTGRLVYRRPDKKELSWDERNWLDKDPLLAEALKGREKAGRITLPVDNEDVIAARVPVPDTGWVVGAARPLETVRDPLLNDLALGLALLLAIAAVSLLVASAISRRVTRPLGRLQAHAVAVGRGDLGHRAEIRGIAELVELGDAFNQMAASLKAAREELERANAELEDRVRRRTTQVVEQTRSLEAFFSHTITPLVFLDPKFNFIRANEAYARACARQVADFPGHNHFEFYPHAENQAIFENVVRTKTLYTAVAKPFTFPDHPEWGVTYWDWTLTPILEDNGEVLFLVFALQDVTERKRAEDAQRAVALYARSLIEASLDPLVTISPEGKITDVNRATEEVTGVSRDRLLGTDFSDYFTDPEHARRGYRQVLAEGLVRDYALTIRHVSGRTTDVLYNATVYRNPAGEVQGVFAAARDITERLEAERRKNVTNSLLELYARKTSRKEYLDSVVELIRDWSGCRCLGVRIKDAENRIPYESFVGFDEDFWKKENWLSLDADPCACVRVVKGQPEAHDRAVMTPRGSFRCEDTAGFLAALTPDEQRMYRGHCIRVGFKSLAIIPVRYREETLGAIHLADERPGLVPQARIEFVESMAPLIGEALQRFNVEDELARYREHLEELVKQRTGELEAANVQLQREMAEREQVQAQMRVLAKFPAENPNPVCRISGDMVLTYSNAAAKPLTDAWKCHVGHRVPPPIEKMVAQAVNSGKVSEVELEVGDRVFSLVFAPMAEAGYVNVYGRNITARRRAEEALKLTVDDLGRSNRDLEQFAYIASHDLQEPLRIVAGYLQLLERRYKDRLDADANDFINFAVDGAARMQTLINDLLAYSRVGTKGSTAAPVNCEEVLARALGNLRTGIEESGARITHDPLPTVSGDGAQLTQVFQNLIGNAIKFHGDKTPEIHVSAAHEDGRWKFSVRDNGIGIDPQYGDRIFILFQRLHTRDKYPGTGIGLVICKRIVERHGGKIWFQPRPGGGTTFYFTI